MWKTTMTMAVVAAHTPAAQTAAPIEFAHEPCGTELVDETVTRHLAEISYGLLTVPEALRQRSFVVPVTIHVIRRSDGTGGIGGNAVAAAMGRVQEAFAPAGIHFCIWGETIYIDDDAFFGCTCNGREDSLRGTARVEGTVNVYFVPRLASGNTPVCGLGTLPGQGNPGILVQNDCTGLPATRSTLIHEFGHFFDLLHTHDRQHGVECADGSNAAFAGDLVVDTPADPNLRGRVNQACEYTGNRHSPCAGDPVLLDPMVENYMSYARQSCRSTFTAGQLERMRAALIHLRPEMARASCPHFDFAPIPGLVRANVTAEGVEADGPTQEAAIAPRGRFVAMATRAPSLMPEGIGPVSVDQILVKDLLTGELELISRGLNGEPANGFCASPALSEDGRYVAYSSTAWNIVPETTAGTSRGNVYRYDRWTRETRLVTPGFERTGGDTFETIRLDMSWDGSVIAFESRATNLLPVDNGSYSRIYVADLARETLVMASRPVNGGLPNGRSFAPAVAGNGRSVAFHSTASNLHPQDTDGLNDVYVYGVGSGTLSLESVFADGFKPPFTQARTPRLDESGTQLVWEWAGMDSFPQDTTGITAGDVMWKDLATGEIHRLSETAEGGATEDDSDSPSISGDGRFVAFRSEANELYGDGRALEDYDVWVKDRSTGRLFLASPGGDDRDSFGDVRDVRISGNGKWVVFLSEGRNHVPGDGNGLADVFVWSGSAGQRRE